MNINTIAKAYEDLQIKSVKDIINRFKSAVIFEDLEVNTSFDCMDFVTVTLTITEGDYIDSMTEALAALYTPYNCIWYDVIDIHKDTNSKGLEMLSIELTNYCDDSVFNLTIIIDPDFFM